jgi:hypothetical protein
MSDRSPKPTAEQVRASRSELSLPMRHAPYRLRMSSTFSGSALSRSKSRRSALVWCGSGHSTRSLTLNAGYKIDEFAKGLFGFSSEGVGELYVFDLHDPQHVTVGQVPSIPLELDQHEVLAESFEEFAAILAGGTSDA